MPQGGGGPLGRSSPQVHAERAFRTYEAMQRAYYDETKGLYRKPRRIFLRPTEVLWPFANALAAAGTLAGVPDEPRGRGEAVQVLQKGVQALVRYAPRREQAAGPAEPLGLGSTLYRPFWSAILRRLWRIGTTYYDDNEWVALALLERHRLDGEQGSLELARRIFAFVVASWCEIPGWSHPGGIRWADAKWSLARNTCSNGPAAEVGAELFLLTGEQDHLDWAERIYAWVYEALRRDDGLYVDQISPEGQLRTRIWSYNQGSMIGAGVLLYESTGDEAYLRQAARTAAASIAHYGRVEALLEEPAIFVTVYLRNLLLLDVVRPEPSYRALAVSYAEAMWERRRDARSGLFLPISGGVNSTAPLVALEAVLGGSPPRP